MCLASSHLELQSAEEARGRLYSAARIPALGILKPEVEIVTKRTTSQPATAAAMSSALSMASQPCMYIYMLDIYIYIYIY